jgi:hypothetical protein
MLRIVRIHGFSQRNPAGKLGRHRLAQEDPAGRTAQCHAGGVRRGTVAFVDGRPVLRGQVSRVHDVLGSEWNSVNRTAVRGVVAFARLRQGKIAIQMDPCFDLRFPRIDPFETGAYQSFGRQFAFANTYGGFTRR